MGFYGNNLGALTTGGTLIYVDVSTGEDIDDTMFDSRSLLVRDIFLDWFGIDGIYQPGSLNRAIKVIVKYVEDDSTVPPVQRHRSPKIQIKTPNVSSIGIAAEEFEPGQIVSAPPRKGAEARTFRLARIVKQSAAFVTYECF